MAIPNIFNTGRSGMVAAKAGIATSGHNIASANVEGYSRQRVLTAADEPRNSVGPHALIGQGVNVNRIERINDEYVEKQIRNGARDMAHMEEKDLILKQTEDVFNEMNGDGINRLMSRFFNEFRKLANEPENDAIRESVREASAAMVNDFHRIRSEVDAVREHIDSRLEGNASEINSLGNQLRDLNVHIRQQTIGGAQPNDLEDQRDQVLKKLATYADLNMHKDGEGNYIVDIKGVGPLVAGSNVEKFSVYRTKADDEGKPENGLDVKTDGSVLGRVTHTIKGGKLGALLEVRDQTLSTVLDRLDDLAYSVSQAVNAVHEQGFNASGEQGTAFFRHLGTKERASEYIDLSNEIKADSSHIATAAIADAPGDNRIALAISSLQDQHMLGDGKITADGFYNAIVADVGVAANRNRQAMTQQKDIQIQLGKIREQSSGVSIDEETANLLQYQHAFDASAKVIQIADEMLKTVLDLKR